MVGPSESIDAQGAGEVIHRRPRPGSRCAGLAGHESLRMTSIGSLEPCMTLGKTARRWLALVGFSQASTVLFAGSAVCLVDLVRSGHFVLTSAEHPVKDQSGAEAVALLVPGFALAAACLAGAIVLFWENGKDEQFNKPDAPNPAIALQFHSERHSRGVGDTKRYAAQAQAPGKGARGP
jgi:hypothetical protein